MARRFGSAPAFKASLETHLRKLASERKIPLSTLQLKFVIERLLARLFRDPEPPWLLKGGFAMDLRFRPHARTTKDVDLGMSLVSAEPVADFSGALRDRIQEAVDVDLRDYLSYRIGAPKQEFTNAPKGGGDTHARRCSSAKRMRSSTSTSGAETRSWGSPSGSPKTTSCGLPGSGRPRCLPSQKPSSSPRSSTPIPSRGLGGSTRERRTWWIWSSSSRSGGWRWVTSGRLCWRRSRLGGRIPFPLDSIHHPRHGPSTFRRWRPRQGYRRRTASKRSRCSKRFGLPMRSVRDSRHDESGRISSVDDQARPRGPSCP